MKTLKSFTITISIVLLVLSCKKDEVIPAPIADFTFVQTANGGVSFSNTSTNATTFSWAFGDGGVSNEASPQHTYTTNSSFTVILTATGAGGTTTSTKIVTVSNVISIVGNWVLSSIAYINCTSPANNQAPASCSSSCPTYTYTATNFTASFAGSTITGTYTISGNTITLTINGGGTVIATFTVTATTLTLTFDGSALGAGCQGVEVDTRQ